MEVTRRAFLKVAVIGGASATALGFDLRPAYAQLPRIENRAREGDAFDVSLLRGGLRRNDLHDRRRREERHPAGDPRRRRPRPSDQPRHAVPQGLFARAGHAESAAAYRSRRCAGPAATDWEDISWDDALNEIAQWTKKTRDATFVEKDANGHTVNRCEGISFIGGCTDTNEFNYLVVKTMRSLGLVYLENQARV